MENKKTGIAPQVDNRIKDFTNSRHYSVRHQFNNDFDWTINVMQDTYLELVKLECKVIEIYDSLNNTQSNITGSLNQNGQSKMTVFDPNTMTMDTAQPASDLVLDFTNGKITPPSYLPDYFKAGYLEIFLSNHIGAQLGSFNLEFRDKIKKPHLFFEFKACQSIRFFVRKTDVIPQVAGVDTNQMSMLFRFEFREYPTSMYYFRQEGRIYS